MTVDKTRGQLEAEVCEGLVKFEKEYMGRGPRETNAYILDDMILVRLKGVLTPAEEKLVSSSEGAALIKRTRVQLLENGRTLLESIIHDITGSAVISLHSDISIKTGERVILFVLEHPLCLQ